MRVDWLVRFGALGLLVSQLLFLRFPWKMGHLLPSLVFLAILLGVALAHRPRLLAALVVAQLLYVVVNVQLVRPDVPNAATTGKLTFDPAWGALGGGHPVPPRRPERLAEHRPRPRRRGLDLRQALGALTDPACESRSPWRPISTQKRLGQVKRHLVGLVSKASSSRAKTHVGSTRKRAFLT